MKRPLNVQAKNQALSIVQSKKRIHQILML